MYFELFTGTSYVSVILRNRMIGDFFFLGGGSYATLMTRTEWKWPRGGVQTGAADYEPCGTWDL